MTGLISMFCIPERSMFRHLVLVWMLPVASVLALSGCGGGQEFAELRRQLDEIRERPRGAIQPPPEFEAKPLHSYSSHKLRNPFQVPAGYDLVADTEVKAVAPDLTRPREYLEQFNIEALRMKGTIQKEGESLVALVDDGTGGTHPVRPGNYLGKNFGRVVSVDETKLSVMEIVPDGHDGWVERPRTIRLDGE